MDKKIGLMERVEFAYAEGVRRDPIAESSMKSNVDMWLRDIEQEIISNDVTIGVVFLSHDKNDVFLLGASVELYANFMECKKKFVL